MEAVSVKINADLLRRLRKVSKETGMSLTWMVNKAVSEWLLNRGIDPVTGKPLPLVPDWSKK